MKKLHTISLLTLNAITAISLAAAPAPPQFRHVEIDSDIQIGYGLAIADVDGDNKPDIILADKSQIVWYQNPTWKKHVIAENLTERDHVCVAAADISGDGKAAIAVGAEWNPGDTVNSGAVFYLIPPSDPTQKWEPVRLHHEPTTHRTRWIQDPSGKFQLAVLPLHGRGNRAGQGEGVRFLAYEKPEDPRQPWKTTLLDDSLHMTHNFDPVQWEPNPAHELLVAAREGVFLLNWQGGQITKSQIGSDEGGGAGEVRGGKLPGGRRFIATIEPMHGNQAVIYTPPHSNSTGALWNRQVIDESLVDGHALASADFLGAGYDQVLVGWRAMNRPGVKVGIKMFIPLNPEGSQWQEHLIDDNQMACEDIAVADLNGNGRPDIIAAGRATKNVKIYFNEGVK
jgi:hypothetical protein